MTRLTREEKKFLFGFIIAAIVYVVVLTSTFTLSFVSNCIIEWPIRRDIKACWNEQKGPAREKGLEAASIFL
jgi:peptidoglycan/LPS O-acetylase OafA/YrhL